MDFNSFDFAVFLPIVFFAYWFLSFKNRWAQNSILLVASYIFYGWWDWRFLFLILGSSVLDFFLGWLIGTRTQKKSKRWLVFVSLLFNLGLLGVFKYYNFFVESFQDTFRLFGADLDSWTLYIILPVGISFYTFQTISYSIDVSRGTIKHTKDPISFLSYVSFFPQLVAGPIERASNLLPQFLKARKFDYDYARAGLQQILWGLFKKIVVADNCAYHANLIFDNPSQYTSWDLVMGTIFFSFQIYCDFSGYSDIAIGTSKLFGVKLKTNFAFPYFSRDIAEFWRRWHISLTTWFRDYIYIPMGGNRVKKWRQVTNVLVVFLISGLWHGPNWTFIVWGAFNALLFVPILLFNLNRVHIEPIKFRGLGRMFGEVGFMILTFFLCANAWVVFRANSIESAAEYFVQMYADLFNFTLHSTFGRDVIWFIVILLVFEWFGRKKEHGLSFKRVNWALPFRWVTYFILIALIFLYTGKPQVFLYFQF
jgi:alginate O-acetyltransferase complex protein AlgI